MDKYSRSVGMSEIGLRGSIACRESLFSLDDDDNNNNDNDNDNNNNV